MKSALENMQLLIKKLGLLNTTSREACCGEAISPVQGYILLEVRRLGNASMQQVADELRMDITTFSRQAKTLEAKRLIVRQPSLEDRRVTFLQLSPEGLILLERIDGYMVEKVERVFSTMSPFEKDIVSKSLVLLNEALDKTDVCCTEKF